MHHIALHPKSAHQKAVLNTGLIEVDPTVIPLHLHLLQKFRFILNLLQQFNGHLFGDTSPANDLDPLIFLPFVDICVKLAGLYSETIDDRLCFIESVVKQGEYYIGADQRFAYFVF